MEMTSGMNPGLLCADQDRIQAWLDGINAFNDTPGNGVTRQYLTDSEWNARLYIQEEMKKLGLEVSMDCMGNVRGTLPGSEPELAPVWTGSHFDTVLHGGQFDGAAGCVAGMEALRLIKEAGIPHRRSITTIAYSAEEPARFGIGCIGSRAMAGVLDVPGLKRFKDKDGKSIYEELQRRGLDPDAIGDLKVGPEDVFCSLELHIEQNSVLEQNHKPVGIVKAICAPLNLLVTVTGVTAHAGGMPMTDRKDAYAAACEMALSLEKIVRENTLSEYCTGTVGEVHVYPNVANVIPGRCEFTVDIRDCSRESMLALDDEVHRSFTEIAARRGVGVEIRFQNSDVPVSCDPVLMELFEKYAGEGGYEHMRLMSGAFHDSLFVGKFTKIGMLFVPSRDGLSHCPEEWTDVADITAATSVLACALADVANRDAL